MKINKDQRGLLFHKGDYVKTLKPGEHFIMPFHKVEVYNITDQFLPTKNLSFLLHDLELIHELHVVDVKDNQIILHYEDGKFTNVLTSGKYAFWIGLKEHKFIPADLNTPYIDDSIDRGILKRPDFTGIAWLCNVDPHEKCLFFVDNNLEKILEPGNYFFWTGPKAISVLKADMRQQQMEVPGQELMTKDKVTLRLNFVCHYKIVDPVKVLTQIKNYEQQVYILMQLALREYVGTLTLDEILQKKEEIGNYILSVLKEKAIELGLELIFTGVKDVILPGEIKDILNQVLIAEKKAQANVIMRREETASTRSLLNTAKIMEENEILYRLKELEYIERISEKIGQITVSGGSQLIEQLKQVFVSDSKKLPQSGE